MPFEISQSSPIYLMFVSNRVSLDYYYHFRGMPIMMWAAKGVVWTRSSYKGEDGGGGGVALSPALVMRALWHFVLPGGLALAS